MNETELREFTVTLTVRVPLIEDEGAGMAEGIIVDALQSESMIVDRIEVMA